MNDVTPPDKGSYGGECQWPSCSTRGAYWFNDTNGRHYCASCARMINDICKRNGQEPSCELRPGANPGCGAFPARPFSCCRCLATLPPGDRLPEPLAPLGCS